MINLPIPAAGRTVEAKDNKPPLVDVEELAREHTGLARRIVELEHEAASHPATIEDDAAQGRLQDTIKRIDDHMKIVEATRTGVKGPFLTATRAVDAFFKSLSDPDGGRQGRLDKVRLMLTRKGTDYLRAKEAAERRKREEEAARLRAIEEQKRREAIEARHEAEALLERDAAAARAAEAEARALRDDAKAASAAADEALAGATAKPAELARTRGAASLGTLTEQWSFKIVAAAQMSPSLLWAYIPMAAKEQAIRSYIRANRPGPGGDVEAFKNSLPGVELTLSAEGSFR